MCTTIHIGDQVRFADREPGALYSVEDRKHVMIAEHDEILVRADEVGAWVRSDRLQVVFCVMEPIDFSSRDSVEAWLDA